MNPLLTQLICNRSVQHLSLLPSSSFQPVMSQRKAAKNALPPKSESEAAVLQQYNDDEGHFSLVRYALLILFALLT